MIILECNHIESVFKKKKSPNIFYNVNKKIKKNEFVLDVLGIEGDTKAMTNRTIVEKRGGGTKNIKSTMFPLRDASLFFRFTLM